MSATEQFHLIPVKSLDELKVRRVQRGRGSEAEEKFKVIFWMLHPTNITNNQGYTVKQENHKVYILT